MSLVTEWIESGRIPYDEKLITEFLEAICYKNAKDFFELTKGGIKMEMTFRWYGHDDR